MSITATIEKPPEVKELPKVSADVQSVLDAMATVQTERDTWVLADALVVAVPKGGDATFEPLCDLAAQFKVDGTGFKPQTLRLYRDTAKAWPAEERIPGVSFSAHREVQNAKELGTFAQKRKTLEQLVVTQGSPGKVTVSSIRRAVKAKGPMAQPGTATTAAPSAPQVNSTVQDLKGGGKQLIAGIPRGLSIDELKEIKTGLNAVLTHVEALISRAPREAAEKKMATSAPTDAEIKERTEKVVANVKGKGDMRGLR